MRYKEVLNKYGVTQIELAERLGINRVSVSRLLSEKNDMRASTLERIAKAIGCEVGEFFREPTETSDTANIILCPNCGKPIRFESGE